MALALAALLTALCLLLLRWSGRLDFVVNEFSSRRRALSGIALLWAVLVAAVFHPALSAGEVADFDPREFAFPALFLLHALLAVFLFIWWRLRRPGPLGQFLHLQRLELNDLERGVWVGSMGWLATMGAGLVAAALLSESGALEQPADLPPIMVWLAHLTVQRKLLLIAAAMTVEEAFFRGFLQPRIGWIPSSVLFALGHASYGMPMLTVGVFVISLVIGRSMQRTGRLMPCIIAHGVFDSIQLLVIVPAVVRMLQNQ